MYLTYMCIYICNYIAAAADVAAAAIPAAAATSAAAAELAAVSAAAGTAAGTAAAGTAAGTTDIGARIFRSKTLPNVLGKMGVFSWVFWLVGQLVFSFGGAYITEILRIHGIRQGLVTITILAIEVGFTLYLWYRYLRVSFWLFRLKWRLRWQRYFGSH